MSDEAKGKRKADEVRAAVLEDEAPITGGASGAEEAGAVETGGDETGLAAVGDGPMAGTPAIEEPSAPLPAMLEALLLATGEPLSTATLAHLVKRKPAEVTAALEALQASYAGDERGLLVVEIAGGWQFGTKPVHAPLIEKMLKEVRHVRLSPAALETLAIIAYRQPITRAEIEAIRGVNVDGVLSTLMDRELVKMVGRKEEVGRPVLYGTSEAFLMHFGLRSLGDLPPLSEFEEIARARADVGEYSAGPNWHALSDEQRAALEELQQAADRELADVDARLRELRPPKVKALHEPAVPGGPSQDGGSEPTPS